MLLVIHNLPNNIKYAEIKTLIQTKCGLDQIILDHLTNEGRHKKVTVGLADDGDAAILVRKINGLYLEGQQLYVEDVRQKKASEQPYRSTRNLLEESCQSNYQPSQSNQWSNNTYQSTSQHDYSDKDKSSAQAPLGFQGNSGFQGIQHNPAMVNMDPMSFMMNYNMANMGMGGMYAMPTLQPENNFLGYGVQQQVTPMIPQMAEVQPQLEPRFSFGSGRNQQKDHGWNENNNRSDTMQHSSFGDRQRAFSPQRGQRSNDFDREVPRWDRSNNEIDSRISRQRSRSPPRDNRDARGSYANRSLDNFNSNRFDEPGSNFNNYSPPNQDRNIFGSHAINQDAPSRWDQPPRSENIPRGGPQQERFMGAPQQMPGGNWREAPQGPPPKGGNRREGPPGGNTRNVPQGPPGGNRREFPQGAPKRFASKWEDDISPPKKVAPSGKPFKNPNNKWNASGPQKASPFKGPQFKGPEQPKKQFRPSIPYQQMKGPKATFQQPNRPFSSNQSQPRPATSGVSDKPINAQFRKREDRKRTSAAIAVTKQMVAKIDLDRSPLKEKKQEIFRLLRDTVKVLLEGMVGTNVFTSEIVNRLRVLHPESDDIKFVYTTLEDQKYPADILNAVKELESAEEKTTKEQTVPRQMMPKDKKLAAGMKKMQKLELADQNLYKLPEAEQKALDKEVDQLVDLFMGECLNPGDNENEKYVCEQIADVASDEFRKMVRLLVTKRLLDIKTSLVLRIYFHEGKLLRPSLENFLQDYNIISLKKSGAKKQSNFYVAVCGSYETYDQLIGLGRTTIDGITVLFKSMHLAGPATMTRQKAMELRKKYIDRQVDRSGENILKPAQNAKTKTGNKETVTENQVKKEQSADTQDLTEDVICESVECKVENTPGETEKNKAPCGNDTKPAKTEKYEPGLGENEIEPVVNETGETENDDWGEGGVPWSDNEGAGDDADDQDIENIDEDDLEDY